MTQPNTRIIFAVLMGLAFLIIALFVYLSGLALGTMAGDGCPSNAPFGISPAWLLCVWPIILLAGVLVPPWLVLRVKRWYWVVLSIILGIAGAAAGFYVWLLIVEQVCYSGR